DGIPPAGKIVTQARSASDGTSRRWRSGLVWIFHADVISVQPPLSTTEKKAASCVWVGIEGAGGGAQWEKRSAATAGLARILPKNAREGSFRGFPGVRTQTGGHRPLSVPGATATSRGPRFRLRRTDEPVTRSSPGSPSRSSGGDGWSSPCVIRVPVGSWVG